MKKLRLLFFVLLFTWILPACQGDPSVYMTDIDLSLSKMNKELHILAQPMLNTLLIGDSVLLTAYNSSSLPVVVGPDFGIHIFRKVDDQWETVYNGMEDVIGNNWILADGSENYLSEIVGILPEVYPQEPVEIRIVML